MCGDSTVANSSKFWTYQISRRRIRTESDYNQIVMLINTINGQITSRCATAQSAWKDFINVMQVNSKRHAQANKASFLNGEITLKAKKSWPRKVDALHKYVKANNGQISLEDQQLVDLIDSLSIEYWDWDNNKYIPDRNENGVHKKLSIQDIYDVEYSEDDPETMKIFSKAIFGACQKVTNNFINDLDSTTITSAKKGYSFSEIENLTQYITYRDIDKYFSNFSKSQGGSVR